MNNQYKRDKKAKIERLNKAKKIGFIVSLVFNALFILLLVIGLALPKDSASEPKNEQNSIVKVLRNNANQMVSDNTNVKSIDFNAFKGVSDISTYVQSSFTYTLDQDMLIISQDTPIASANFIEVSINVNPNPYNYDYVRVSARNNNSGTLSGYILYVEYVYLNGDWQINRIPQEGSYYNSSGGFSLVFNQDYSDSVNFSFTYLYPFFEQLNYSDLSLADSWSPYSFWSTRQSDFIISTDTSTFIDLSDYVVFSVGGHLYTNLRVVLNSYSGSGTYKYWDGTNLVDIATRYRYIMFVQAYNLVTGEAITLMTREYHNEVVDGTLQEYFYPEYSLHFVNSVTASIRLFNINLNSSSHRDGYTNGQIFTTSFNPYYGVGESQYTGFGDVFGLFTTSFKGLTGLFSITILPNITLGMLLFLPLVAIIVFAIIKVVKK